MSEKTELSNEDAFFAHVQAANAKTLSGNRLAPQWARWALKAWEEELAMERTPMGRRTREFKLAYLEWAAVMGATLLEEWLNGNLDPFETEIPVKLSWFHYTSKTLGALEDNADATDRVRNAWCTLVDALRLDDPTYHQLPVPRSSAENTGES